LWGQAFQTAAGHLPGAPRGSAAAARKGCPALVRRGKRPALAVLVGVVPLLSLAEAEQAQPTAAASPKEATAAVALLEQGAKELQQNQPAEAAKLLRAAFEKLPKIGDHIAYLLASAEFNLGNFPGTIREARQVWASGMTSPVAGSAAILAARAHGQSGNPGQAVAILKEHYARLPQPAGDSLLAQSCEAANDPASAALYYQQVYFEYPATPEAEGAGAALALLQSSLGSAYPPPMPQAMFRRAERWIQAGYSRRARTEYESMLSRVAGLEREQARVRIGAIEYLTYQASSAYSYLKALQLSFREADAERLYYMAESARRLERDGDMLAAVDRLSELYPDSPWRLKALVSAGNRFLVQNQTANYERLYRACYEFFPSEPQADNCHWKVLWLAYLNRKPEATRMLRAHLVNYPGSEKAGAALYFLGRLAEEQKDLAAAKAFYDEAVSRFSNHFYAGLAEERLARVEFFRVIASGDVARFLNLVVWPVHRYPDKFEPTPATRLRIERARLLSAAGLDNVAEGELRFGAAADGQPHILAIEAAKMAGRESPARAIRIVKSMVPGYLSIPLEHGPPAFWRALFPLPYRQELERNARQRGIEPFLLAGLIRQESEFDPQAISRARAYGLTQVLPSTGRALARKLGPRGFQPRMLFRPEINLRLGTAHLRDMYDLHSAQWEHTLAAYNAGGSRVKNWVTWGDFREPAEFVETIPFTETRNYVFSVLRNAQMYRRLYGPEKPVLSIADGIVPKAAEAKKAVSKKSTKFERKPVVPKKSKPAPKKGTARKRK
jgi:soluble lytic murein transglycosylase